MLLLLGATRRFAPAKDLLKDTVIAGEADCSNEGATAEENNDL